MFCLFAVLFLNASLVILNVNMWRPQAARCGAQRGAAWLPNQAAQRAPKQHLQLFNTVYSDPRRAAPSGAEQRRASPGARESKRLSSRRY